MVEVVIKDERLSRYVEKVYEKMGVFFKNYYCDTDIHIMNKWKLIEREQFFSFYGAKPYIEIYENKEDHEFLAVLFQSTGDGFIYSVWKTKQFLNVKRVRNTLMPLDQLELEFRVKNPNFTCWECGHRSHILDIEGSLETKLNKYEDECCCE